VSKHLNLDHDGAGLAYENGYRDGLREGMKLQSDATNLHMAEVVEALETRTVELIAAWLERGSYRPAPGTEEHFRYWEEAAVKIREGVWRPK
jgi:hypothetical protein